MSRCLETVEEAYREWYIGLNGAPSIVEMEQRYGTKWRRAGADRKYFQRRKKIMEKIRNVSETEQVSVEVAVARVERLRDGRSLDWLAKALGCDRRLT